MRTEKLVTAATYATLGSVAVVSLLLPAELTLPQAWGAGPATMRITGTVRDFRQAHVDFDVVPDAGYGHYAGSVKETLGGDGRPVLSLPGINHGGGTDEVDLIARWAMDDGGGGTAADDVGFNDGSLMSGPQWVPGKDGGGLHFDGVDDYVEIPSSPQMQITGDITFSGWFKLDADFDPSSPSTLVVMEKFLDVDHDFHIALAGGDYNRPEVTKGSLVFKVENGPTSDYYCYTWSNRTSWTMGQWYHFACVLKSGDTAQNRVFIDGVDDTSSVIAAGVGFLDTDYDAPVRIGGKTIDYNGFANDIYFQGTIDDVMIFSRVLTEADFTETTGGFKVTNEWRDSASRPIPPHLYANGASELAGVQGVAATGSVRVFNGGIIDHVPGGTLVVSTNMSNGANIVTAVKTGSLIDGDVLVGPAGDTTAMVTATQGGVISGVAGNLPAEITFPTITPPAIGPSLGDLSYSADTLLSTDLHVDSLSVSNGAVVTVNAPVTIVIEEELLVENSCQIQLGPGARLDVYILGKLANDGLPGELILENATQVNTTVADPSRVHVYYLGTEDIHTGNGVLAYMNLFAPDVKLVVENGAHIWGNFVGSRLEVLQSPATFTAMGAFGTSKPASDGCGNALDDTAGTAGTTSTGGIDSVVSFDGWFRDVMGANLAAYHTITLTDNGSGVYEYLDDAFYPIDDRLFGNDGASHNYLFTYGIAAGFVYSGCASQFVEFVGSDDAWVFVDDKLVLDIGGVMPGTGQHIDLDRLGLVDGQAYALRIFFAQRQSIESRFRLRTNLWLTGPDTVAAGGSFD